uniref:Uncharacterized protein n=3 Tax=Candidatus Kentrum sp. FM TaxID=2126340 RepID=A0A450T4P3_9GAMM|nr:MAG: hypothetical protein BECKFM1743C_GA0114222_102914 [Candidatus Kentron sp. FM]
MSNFSFIKIYWLLLDSGLMADLCNYPSEIDMDGQMFGGEHFGSPLRSPERRGESCIRPLCLIRLYAQKLRIHRAMLYAFRRSTRNPIRANLLHLYPLDISVNYCE